MWECFSQSSQCVALMTLNFLIFGHIVCQFWGLSPECCVCVYEKYTEIYTCVCMLYVFVTLDKICYQSTEWMAAAGLNKWFYWHFIAYF